MVGSQEFYDEVILIALEDSNMVFRFSLEAFPPGHGYWVVPLFSPKNTNENAIVSLTSHQMKLGFL